MGRQDVGAIADAMALWNMQEEVRRLRLAQETMTRHIARVAETAHKAVCRELGELTDIIDWNTVEDRHDFWLEFGALCAVGRLAETPDSLAVPLLVWEAQALLRVLPKKKKRTVKGLYRAMRRLALPSPKK